VVAELAAHLDVLGLDKALLAPANPALGRTIKNGYYFLNDRPVHESSFGSDPEFAITSSRVEDMLRLPVQVRRPGEELPDKGIIVGEVQSKEDLDAWAKVAGQTGKSFASQAGKSFADQAGKSFAGQVGKPLFLAGAAGFFAAILQERISPGKRKNTTAPQGYPILLVSGTTFGRNRDLLHEIHAAGGPVYYANEDNSCEAIVNHLLDQGLAIIAAGEEVVGEPLEAARRMRDRMAELVSQVLMEVAVEELVIEGGATAHAILTWAGLRTFFPEEELAPGVIRMRAGEGSPLHLTVKPGSYEWPERLRQRLQN
jgi:uncharacterized protein YgbK (DUF1537 family)